MNQILTVGYWDIGPPPTFFSKCRCCSTVFRLSGLEMKKLKTSCPSIPPQAYQLELSLAVSHRIPLAKV